jgi:hypothetical protein
LRIYHALKARTIYETRLSIAGFLKKATSKTQKFGAGIWGTGAMLLAEAANSSREGKEGLRLYPATLDEEGHLAPTQEASSARNPAWSSPRRGEVVCHTEKNSFPMAETPVPRDLFQTGLQRTIIETSNRNVGMNARRVKTM